MSKVRIYGDTSGYIDVAAPATADNSTLDLSTVAKTTGADFTNTVEITKTSAGASTNGLVINNADNTAGTAASIGFAPHGSGTETHRLECAVDGPNSYSMRFYTYQSGLNERMRIDASGRVTMPNQPAFHAYVSNSYSASATDELVKFNGTTFNTGNHFDISAGNHKFVAPIDGVYSFQSTVNTYNVGVGQLVRVDLYINGSAVSRGDYMVSDHTGDQNVSIAITRSLSANDYVQIHHISGDSSRGYSGGGTWVWFSGFLVG